MKCDKSRYFSVFTYNNSEQSYRHLTIHIFPIYSYTAFRHVAYLIKGVVLQPLLTAAIFCIFLAIEDFYMT